MFLLIVPGQYATSFHLCRMEIQAYYSEPETYYAHGWPLRYLDRSLAYRIQRGNQLIDANAWDIGFGVEEFRWWALLIDLLVAAGVILGSALLFEYWRRQRRQLWQFHIGDMLALALVVSLGGAYFVHQRAQHRHELVILETIDQFPNSDGWVEPFHERVAWRRGGPTWMRQLFGNAWPGMFDRVIEVSIDKEAEALHLTGLRHVRAVHAFDISNEGLNEIAKLPRLEILTWSSWDSAVVLRLPPMPQLRGLNLQRTKFSGDGLENVPNLEELVIKDTDVRDSSVPAICRMRKLRILWARGCRISPDGFEQIRQALPDCKIDVGDSESKERYRMRPE